jgi:hypothetical protein
LRVKINETDLQYENEAAQVHSARSPFISSNNRKPRPQREGVALSFYASRFAAIRFAARCKFLAGTTPLELVILR